jgi:DNA repair protein RadA/Sms
MSKLATKTITQYVCQECGSSSRKWQGKCEDCGAWNSFAEETIIASKKTSPLNSSSAFFEALDSDVQDPPRINSTISELDRVLGGGLVKGSAVLIGGDPGIGKSTLLLQLVAKLASNNVHAAYITGEESVEQVRLRARRLGLNTAPVKLMSATNVNDIIASINSDKTIQLLVIDSIQTMFVSEYSSAPGTVSQVRAAAHEIISIAKKYGIIVLLVGHVTKEGQLAGPKVLEHMVDTVLYFEGERGNHFRIIRAVKNRFGGVNEIGVFEMSDAGLIEVTNPSSLFLSSRDRNISGSSVFAGIEGTRPLLAEVQALISPSFLPTPRRAVVGWDINRLAMVIAVLGVRYGLNLADKEVYLNVAGGLKIIEPAADLAMASALISSVTNIPLPDKSIIFGEIGLSGEIRNVSHSEIRLKEAVKLGFTSAFIPAGSKYNRLKNIEIFEIAHIKQLKDFLSKK